MDNLTRYNDHGYVEIYCPEHPHSNAGYVLEHRYVVEQSIGRFLTPGEVVHHINEIKYDNRVRNLYLCTQEEHARIHNRCATMSNERRNNIRKGLRTSRQKQKNL